MNKCVQGRTAKYRAVADGQSYVGVLNRDRIAYILRGLAAHVREGRIWQMLIATSPRLSKACKETICTNCRNPSTRRVPISMRVPPMPSQSVCDPPAQQLWISPMPWRGARGIITPCPMLAMVRTSISLAQRPVSGQSDHDTHRLWN